MLKKPQWVSAQQKYSHFRSCVTGPVLWTSENLSFGSCCVEVWAIASWICNWGAGVNLDVVAGENSHTDIVFLPSSGIWSRPMYLNWGKLCIEIWMRTVYWGHPPAASPPDAGTGGSGNPEPVSRFFALCIFFQWQLLRLWSTGIQCRERGEALPVPLRNILLSPQHWNMQPAWDQNFH